MISCGIGIMMTNVLPSLPAHVWVWIFEALSCFLPDLLQVPLVCRDWYVWSRRTVDRATLRTLRCVSELKPSSSVLHLYRAEEERLLYAATVQKSLEAWNDRGECVRKIDFEKYTNEHGVPDIFYSIVCGGGGGGKKKWYACSGGYKLRASNDQGQTLHALDVPSGHGGLYLRLYYAKNTLYVSNADGRILRWNEKDEYVDTFSRHYARVIGMCYAEDANVLYTGDEQGIVKIWNDRGASLFFNANPDGRCLDGLGCICCDDGLLYTGHRNGDIRVWNVRVIGKSFFRKVRDAVHGYHVSVARVRTLTGHERAVRCFCFADDVLYSASERVGRNIRAWNRQGQCIRVLDHRPGAVRFMYYTNDVLYTAGSVVNIWKKNLKDQNRNSKS